MTRRVTGILGFLAICALLTTAAQAQFLPFGRNKIAYTEFDWHVLRTTHFDIYFYQDMEELARHGAALAEQSFAALEQKFDFTVRHRIPLIFYSSPIHFQQTNTTPGFIPEGVGGFFEFIKGRVVIPASGSMEQFRHVINHELVHVFMHTLIEETLRNHGRPIDRYPPLWFVEGLAELYSTTWDSQAEMLMRDAVLNGYAAPLASIAYISGSFLMYKEGQDALAFMERRYGPHVIVRLIEKVWLSPDFNDVMRAVLGVGYEEFDREWIRDLRRRYLPLVASHERPSDASDAVATSGFNAKPAVWRNGDSTCVVYIGNRTGYSCLYGTGTGGGEPRLLLQGEKVDELEAFHLFQGKMSVSATGRLAFVTKSGGSDVLHLFLLRSGELTRTLVFRDLVMLGTVSWSPDGRHLAMSAIDKSGRSDLYVVDADADSLRRLTNDFYDDKDPAWSPDGRTIAFVSDREPAGVRGKYGLFAIDPATADIRYLACDTAVFAAPSWSPDGACIALTSDRDGTSNIYVLRFDSAAARGADLRRVTRFITAAYDPVWTDSGAIVFTAFDGYAFQIRSIDGVRARIDSLERVPVPRFDTTHSAWTTPLLAGDAGLETARYEKRYTLDIAQSQISTDPVFGTIGGAALSVSDLFGNDNFNFLIYNTAQTSSELLSSFNVAISRVFTGQRTPYAYGIFNFAGRRYDLLDPDLYFNERAFGGYFAMAYPLSMFRRIEGSVSLSSSDKEALFDLRQRKALLLTNSVSYVKDNALYYYTGPIDGNRFNLTLSYTTDIQYSNVNYFSVMFDYRRYFRIGLRSLVATRFELLYNHGTEARRYFLGGSWDLRGWPRWSIRGTKRWLTSCELRFPLLDRVGFDFPFGPVDLGILRGAMYVDAGNAWDTEYAETLGSIGAGLRFSLFGIIVLRYDFGKRIERNFRSLQSDLYSQFFFGWDF